MTFLIGIMGSVHCSTMCGAFVLTCSGTKKQNVAYQFGRLFSYLILSTIIFSLGSFIRLESFSKELSIIAGFILGGAFLYLGLKGIMGLKLKIKMPKLIEKLTFFLWGKALRSKEKNIKISFTIGSLSILLPCGLLYSLVVPLTAIDSLGWAFVSVLSFWMGTLPVMAWAPILFRRIIEPIRAKAPVVVSSFFIIFGFLIIGSRVLKIQNKPFNKVEMQICH
jgi:hypothetical protein